MDLTRLLSTFLPLMVELLLLAQDTNSKAPAKSLRVRRGSGSKKLKILKRLLAEVTADQTLGLVRLKKDGLEEINHFPSTLKDVLKGEDTKTESEDDASFMGSGVEDSAPTVVRGNQMSGTKHSDQHYEYKNIGKWV